MRVAQNKMEETIQLTAYEATESVRSSEAGVLSAAIRHEVKRLSFLDALRGVGAFAVVVQHVGEQLSPSFVHFTTYYFQLGQFGVMVFFLCSGFIIPHSLERQGSLRLFWLGRFFRLYPLYWLSLAAAVVLANLGVYSLPAAFARAPISTTLANLTMLQTFAGIPNAIPLYWSLAFEMLFYFLVSGLFIVDLHRHTIFLAITALLLSLAIGTVFPLILRLPTPIGLIFNLATMFVGTVAYRLYSKETTFRTALLVVVLTVGTIVVTLSASFLGRDNPATGGTRSFLPMLTAWLGAYVIFGTAFLCYFWRFPRAIVYLGTISYSLYLFHPLIISAIPNSLHPIITGIIWVVTTIGLSALTYRYIETPCIEIGRLVVRNSAQYQKRSDGNVRKLIL